jgi:four helix bundle protein
LEGAARKGDKEFIQFLYIAMGSISEIETQLILAERLHFIDSIEVYLIQIEKIKKMLLTDTIYK